MGVWDDPSINLIQNPQFHNRTGDIPSGWTEFGFTGNVSWDDTNPDYSVATITAATSRPRLRQSPIAGTTANGRFTLYAHVSENDTATSNEGALRTVSENLRAGNSTFYTTPGWYAIGYLADNEVPDLRVGLGMSGNVIGTLIVSRPCFRGGWVDGITAEGNHIGPLADEPVLTPGTTTVDVIREMASRHVDIATVGDSNSHAASRGGWQYGLQHALAQRYKMFATGFTSGGEQELAALGAINLGYGWTSSPLRSPFAITGAPAALDAFFDTGGMDPHDYAYLASGTYSSFGGINLWYPEAGVEDEPDVLGINGNLRFDVHWGSFTTGTGSFQCNISNALAPSFNWGSDSVVNTNTGVEEMNVNQFALAAGTRNKKLQCRLSLIHTMNGPTFFTYMRVYNTDRSAGFAVSVLYGQSGNSARDQAAALQALSDTHLTHYFSIMRAGQTQATKRIIIFINNAVNDRAEGGTSVGIGAVTDPDSQAAYQDNLQAIIDKIRGIWSTNAWDADSELFFLIAPTPPIDDPLDPEIELYRTGANLVAQCNINTVSFDFSDVTDEAEMLASGWYNNPPSDQVHLSFAGYENLSRKMLEVLVPTGGSGRGRAVRRRSRARGHQGVRRS